MNYLLLLRGVNVGSKNRVRMDDLKQMLQALGFHKNSTYINSGNAIFESDLNEEDILEMISQAFIPKFGFSCDMTIRTLSDMESVIRDFPYSESEILNAKKYDPEVEHLYVYFLEESVDKYLEKLEVSGNSDNSDRIVAHNRELYLLTHESVRKSRLALKLARVCPMATARNMNTVEKLTEMLKKL